MAYDKRIAHISYITTVEDSMHSLYFNMFAKVKANYDVTCSKRSLEYIIVGVGRPLLDSPMCYMNVKNTTPHFIWYVSILGLYI